MNDENNDAALKLQKLGERLRMGLNHRRPVDEKIDVRKIVREQFPKEIEERRKLAEQRDKDAFARDGEEWKE